METIFLTQPRQFQDTDNTTFLIVGLSAKVSSNQEVFLGNQLPIKFDISFWRNTNDVLIREDTKTGSINKSYEVPNLGNVDILSGLFSSSKESIYQAASILAAYYGYSLLPLEDQIHLNANM